ncbi:hypothetical protein SGLAD_v1c03590 [Spiroplasma gladiatoris]|uniref:Uncharacterized protein n=1 Tax=Spiroplasma gladiatoris TaxID=2143 RepID=A0A4P7AII1_9MOLU|nr:hypothetical protein [Spiroplasma gladiatoris]QBQ07558.1 hypothetical protein SGLAD_v1c03590 [Spiroplasma gladiatoris]
MFLADGLGGLFGGSNVTTTIIFAVIVLVIIIFIVISSITSKKAQKKEQAKRKKVVKEEIKNYLSQTQNLKNIKLEYEKVYARKGPEYKYRDVFDVIVQMYEPKTNELIKTAAYEVEGMTTKADKKTYTTAWQVNKELDIEDTKKRIAIAEKKIKLSKEELKIMKAESLVKSREAKANLKAKEAKLKEVRAKEKANPNVRVASELKATTVKFIPKRNK